MKVNVYGFSVRLYMFMQHLKIPAKRFLKGHVRAHLKIAFPVLSANMTNRDTTDNCPENEITRGIPTAYLLHFVLFSKKKISIAQRFIIFLNEHSLGVDFNY